MTISDAKMAVERNSKGVYLMLRNKITNNRLSLLLDEGTKKLVLDSEISGEWTGADPIITKSDLTNVLQSVVGPQGDRLSSIKVVDSNTSKPYIAVYLNGSSDRYGYIPITKG